MGWRASSLDGVPGGGRAGGKAGWDIVEAMQRCSAAAGVQAAVPCAHHVHNPHGCSKCSCWAARSLLSWRTRCLVTHGDSWELVAACSILPADCLHPDSLC